MEWKLNRVRDSWTYIRNALGLPRSPERHILYHFVCSVSCTVVIGTPLLYQGAAASDRTCNKAKGGDASSTRRVEEAKCYDASGAKVNRILFGSTTKLAHR